MNRARRPAGPSRRAERVAAPRRPAGGWFAHPALLAALAALLLHLPVLGLGFVRDDHALIERNPFLLRPEWLGRLLVSDFWAPAGDRSGLWRPVVGLSYALDARLAGAGAAWFHGVNLVLHAIVVALVTALALGSGTTRVAALVAGLWFAVMPVHVESVAWISGRTDLLCAAFFVAALLLDRRDRAAGRTRPGVLACAALALALLAKEAAAPFVLVAAVQDRVERPAARWSATARWLAPYAAVTTVYLIAHAVLAPTPERPPYVDAITIARRHWAGLTLLPGFVAYLWPGFPHMPEREPALPSSPLDPTVIGAAALLLAAAAGLAVLTRRRAPIATPLAVFGAGLLPVIGAAVVGGTVTFSERLLYVPSVGAAWALALGLARAARAPAWARAAALVAAGGLVAWSAVVTTRLVPTWRSDATMYAAMVRVQPRHVKARVGLAESLASAGDEAGAREQLRVAESIDPRVPEIYVSRAGLGFRRAAWDDVLADARRALALDPRILEAELLGGTALIRLRRYAEADSAVAHMRAERPGEPAFDGLEGQLRLVTGKAAEAVPLLERASRWSPDDASTWYALGMASLATERAAPAREAFAKTVEIDPRYYDGWLRLALASHLASDAAGRDRALARAAELPEAVDGRVEEMRRQLVGAP